jgi:predicted RNA binding protein YcfA (HicA-like mRNA interferase family)
MKKIVFTFGRYNPPTTGHAELITYAVRLAHRNGADHRIYTSQSHDASKNPLSAPQKITFLRQIFPGVNFVADPNMKTAFAICKKLVDEGYEDVTFVVGDDRVAEFKAALGKYVKPKTAKDFDSKKHYPFKKFQVVSSGGRKEGISGTALRAAVRKGDFTTFARASAARDKALARKIFTATKKNLAEETEISEVTSREMHKHITSKGWTLERKGKSHDLYSHPQAKNGRRITLPRHPGDLDRRLAKEIDKQTERYIREEKGMSRKDFHDKLTSFIDFTCNHLGIKETPILKYKEANEQGDQPSFAAYSPSAKEVIIMTKNRHPMDIFRSVAHELVHHKQNEDGRLGKDIAKEGSTGSDIENEANSEAGKIMRYFGKENPFYFDMSYIGESKAIILGGTPGSGKDLLLKEAILPYDFTEINADEFHKHELDGNIVVNGTASDFNKISYIKEQLENIGYETMMVFVTTSDEASRQRNEERGVRGGRVISEMVRFGKWQDGQHNMEKYAQLFENYYSIDNSIDLRHANEEEINLHTLSKKKLAESVYRFMIGETDYQFEKMVGEDYGAGFWGTNELTDKYKKDTPGQEPGGFATMKVLSFKERMRDVATTVPSKAKEAPMPSLPIGADRIGDEYGFPKSPSFGDNQTIDQTGVSAIMDPIARWMVKEETKKRFKAKYGALAEQKIREMGAKLAKEAYGDAFYNMTAMANATGGPAEDQDLISNKSNDQADAEKQSIFGFKSFKRNRKLNTKKN